MPSGVRLRSATDWRCDRAVSELVQQRVRPPVGRCRPSTATAAASTSLPYTPLRTLAPSAGQTLWKSSSPRHPEQPSAAAEAELEHPAITYITEVPVGVEEAALYADATLAAAPVLAAMPLPPRAASPRALPLPPQTVCRPTPTIVGCTMQQIARLCVNDEGQPQPLPHRSPPSPNRTSRSSPGKYEPPHRNAPLTHHTTQRHVTPRHTTPYHTTTRHTTPRHTRRPTSPLLA